MAESHGPQSKLDIVGWLLAGAIAKPDMSYPPLALALGVAGVGIALEGQMAAFVQPMPVRW